MILNALTYNIPTGYFNLTNICHMLNILIPLLQIKNLYVSAYLPVEEYEKTSLELDMGFIMNTGIRDNTHWLFKTETLNRVSLGIVMEATDAFTSGTGV